MKRIMMTGGSGIAGHVVLQHLVEDCGYEVLNIEAKLPADPPERKRRICWRYIDVRDLATAVAKCVETDGHGYQVVNIAADDSAAIVPTMDLIKEYMPDVELKEEFPGFKSMLSNRKFKETFGWEPTHNWRDYVDPASYQD